MARKLKIVIYLVVKLSLILSAARGWGRNRLFGKSIPLATWIDVTNRCPANCAYCELSKSGKKDMPLPDLRAIVSELKRLGCVRIHLTGGDPLIRDDIGEIIRFVKAEGMFLTLSTREHFVPKRIESLKQADMVFLSFEGSEGAHNALKGNGSYSSLLDAFELLKKTSVRFLTTTTLTKENKNEIGFILETARRYGFITNFQCLHYPLGSREPAGFTNKHPLSDILLSEEEHQAIGKELLALKRRGEPIATSAQCLRYIFMDWKDHRRIFLPYRLPNSPICRAGKLFCQIDVDGIVYPCGSTFERACRDGYLNAREVGVQRAIAHLTESECKACLQACHVELNLLLSLNVQTVIRWWRQLRPPA